MGSLISFHGRIKPKTVDNLLDEASECHTYIHRLKAEARLTYGTKGDTFEYVRGLLAELESYLNNSSHYLEWVQDQQAELSILGNLPIELMEDRYEKIGKRIKAYRAKNLPRVIALPKKEA
jgi:hypothetical protein